MNAKLTRVSREQARRLPHQSDDARLDAMTDADIAKSVADDPDAPPLDLDWTKAALSLPPGKGVVTLRLDSDVLAWFRAQGKGYQTRINQVLRAFYEARRNPLAADVVEAIKAFRRGSQEAGEIEIPEDLEEQVRTILSMHPDLRWDDAIQIVFARLRAGEEAE
jgi:uncharacterized protein (DUF4415 family)